MDGGGARRAVGGGDGEEGAGRATEGGRPPACVLATLRCDYPPCGRGSLGKRSGV